MNISAISQCGNVIFDMDGVIFDTESIWQRMFVEVNNVYGLDLTEEDRCKTCGMDENSIRKELAARFPGTDIASYRNLLVKRVRDEISANGAPVKRGFIECVEYLRKSGFKLALATSSDRDRALLLFRKSDLDPAEIFDAMIFSNDVAVAKPDPSIFLTAAKSLGVAPSSCMVLEDSANGIEAAVRGGFVPIMVVDLIPPTEYEISRCALIAENLNKIISVLRRINFNE